MPRKCCVWKCTSNYKTDTDKLYKVLSFPKDPEERRKWVLALPNKLKNNDASIYQGICTLHWSQVDDNGELIPLERGSVPMVHNSGPCPRPAIPPFYFTNCEKSNFVQSNKTTPRTAKKATVESRAIDIDEIDAFNAQDLFPLDTFHTRFKDEIREYGDFYEIVIDVGVTQYVLQSREREGAIHKFSVYFTVSQFTSNSIVVQYDAYKLGKKMYSPSIKCISRSSELTELMRCIIHEPINEKHSFLLRQMTLQSLPKNGSIYDRTDFLLSYEWFSHSRSLYSLLRKHLVLPSISTLQRITNVTRSTPDNVLFKSFFSSLEERQRFCILIIDEVYVKAAVTYRGGTVYGYADDNQREKATTILCFMVKCLFGGQTFVVKLLPNHKLTAQYQFDNTIQVIQLLHDCGGTVFAIINDNNRVNQLFFKLFTTTDPQKPWHAVSPVDPSKPLYLMYDSVHIFKNIRNNWIDEKLQTLRFVIGEETLEAKWSDLISLYTFESLPTASGSKTKLKVSTLTKTSLNPTNTEKQKMSLVLNVFSEATTAALKTSSSTTASMQITATFIELVLSWLKVVNAKSPKTAFHKRDEERAVIYDLDSPQLKVLIDWASRALDMKTKKVCP